MSLMACILVSRLANYTAKGLRSSITTGRYVGAAQFSTSSPFCSAPNVVVYSSDNEGKYFKISSLLSRIFSPDTLAVYPLSRETLLKSDAAWLNNVRGLVLDDCDRLSREETVRLLAFFNQGGRILDLGSNLCKHIGIGRGDGVVEQEADRPITKLGNIVVRTKGLFSSGVKVKSDEFTLTPVLSDSQGKAVALEVAKPSSNGKALLSRIPFHLSADDLKLSADVVALFERQTSDRDAMVLNLLKRLEFVPQNYALQTGSPTKQSPTKSTSSSSSPSANPIFVFGKPAARVIGALNSVSKYRGIQEGEAANQKGFNPKNYFTGLTTRQLGNAVLYQPVCESTMDLVKAARSHIDAKDIGLIGISDRQTNGIGRAGNKWLSPPGCAMFTFNIAVDANSGLGRRLPLVQSVAALSCVTAIKEIFSKVKSTKGNEVDIRIKWPNDIYVDGKTKIGGILVHSSILGSTMQCSVGIGLNLSNDEPTLCLNRICATNNMPEISREQLISSIMNHFEKYVDDINAFKFNEVIDLYCKNWLHTDQRVVVRDECQTDFCTVPLRRNPPPSNPHAEPTSSLRSGQVRRIDEFGYLVVEFPDRSTASLHPDGNSFDAMNGLILPKLTQPGYKEGVSDEKEVPQMGDADYPRSKNVRGMVYQVR